MKMSIQNFSDPHVMGAACAAVNEITAMSNSVYKSVLVVITSGTYQVCYCCACSDCVFTCMHTGCCRAQV